MKVVCKVKRHSFEAKNETSEPEQHWMGSNHKIKTLFTSLLPVVPTIRAVCAETAPGKGMKGKER